MIQTFDGKVQRLIIRNRHGPGHAPNAKAVRFHQQPKNVPEAEVWQTVGVVTGTVATVVGVVAVLVGVELPPPFDPPLLATVVGVVAAVVGVEPPGVVVGVVTTVLEVLATAVLAK